MSGLTKSEIEHTLTLISKNEREGWYYGPKEVYWRISARIKAKLGPALLAEIEAKREKVVPTKDPGCTCCWNCPCGCDLGVRKHKFCPQCGREISWT